jgi:hypothetical protein
MILFEGRKGNKIKEIKYDDLGICVFVIDRYDIHRFKKTVLYF